MKENDKAKEKPDIRISCEEMMKEVKKQLAGKGYSEELLLHIMRLTHIQYCIAEKSMAEAIAIGESKALLIYGNEVKNII